MMCYENGGTVDDLLVYKVNGEEYFLVINASNIDKDVAWIKQNAEGFNVEITDQVLIMEKLQFKALKAEETVENVLEIPVKDIAFYNFKTFPIDGEEVIVSRTGYTGEDGFEVYGATSSHRKYGTNLWKPAFSPVASVVATHSALKLAFLSTAMNSQPTSLLSRQASACS